MTQIYGFYTPPSSETFLPFVKINCQEGRVLRVDRTPTPQGWQANEVDITATFRFIPDFTKLELGFIRFGDPGVDFQMQSFDAWVAAGRPRKSPGEGYRFGFRVPILLTKECRLEEGDVRYLSATSVGVVEAISGQFAAYQQRAETGMAMLPVLKLESFEKKLRGQFRNFEPVFVAGEKWLERPDIFDEKLNQMPETISEDQNADEDNLPF
jgi:hypothetical protein